MTRFLKPLSLIACLGITPGLSGPGTGGEVRAQGAGDAKPAPDANSDAKADSDAGPQRPAETRVRKTEDEWRRILTPNQFMVTRLKATEAPFTGAYSRGHFNGTFLCVCCGAELFASRTKFESGTGWPSFWQPIRKDAVSTRWDYSEAQPRVEVMCRRCDAHLGHVFDDGPPPTGLRYCMNSVALKLRPAAGAAKGSTSKGKAAKSKVKAKGAEKGPGGTGKGPQEG